MTVSSNVNTTQFLGSGSSGPFSFGFKFYNNEEIAVIFIDTQGNSTLYAEGMHYTLSGAGDPDGGILNLASPLLADEKIKVIRTLDIVQATAFKNQGAFYPELHEDTFDKLTMILQQLDSRITEIETVGYTFNINQGGTGNAGMTLFPTSGGNVVVDLPASGTVGAMKSGSDANIVTFAVTEVGQTINGGNPPTLETDGAFVWLTLLGTDWKITG